MVLLLIALGCKSFCWSVLCNDSLDDLRALLALLFLTVAESPPGCWLLPLSGRSSCWFEAATPSKTFSYIGMRCAPSARDSPAWILSSSLFIIYDKWVISWNSGSLISLNSFISIDSSLCFWHIQHSEVSSHWSEFLIRGLPRIRVKTKSSLLCAFILCWWRSWPTIRSSSLNRWDHW